MGPISEDVPVQDWQVNRVAWFRRPRDEFGGYSNMSKAYPLSVCGVRIRSSEHLYQAMRFSHEPAVQCKVLNAKTPMRSKQIFRDNTALTRPDWMEVRVEVMWWVLRVKLAQHLESFGSLLQLSRPRPIVEWSRHDSFWGAGPVDDCTLRGRNVLGRLLTDLRDQFSEHPQDAATVLAPEWPELSLLGTRVGILRADNQRPLITGHDLLKRGFVPGPKYGIVL